MQRHTGVGGRVDAGQLLAVQLEELVVPEVDGPSHHGSLEARCAIYRREGAQSERSTSNTVSASANGVPRRQRLITRG